MGALETKDRLRLYKVSGSPAGIRVNRPGGGGREERPERIYPCDEGGRGRHEIRGVREFSTDVTTW